MRGKPIPSQKVGPKLRAYLLAKEWDEIAAGNGLRVIDPELQRLAVQEAWERR